MNVIGPIKAGNTFALTATLRDFDGSLIVGAASKLKSQVRDIKSKLISDLVITELGNGQYLLKATDTSRWPTGLLNMDIQYTNNDAVISSETINISVTKGVTL